ncbi:MAG: rRNA maturation RNase YbeY [Pseudomonadales bacterium]|nr:rRNA maturation RNase YbeY [Pseudomonadales bacterium]
MSFTIHVENGCNSGDSIPDQAQFYQWVQTALQLFKKDGEVNIRIVESDEMTKLNGQYRNKKKPTNVLAFAYHPAEDEVNPLLGDIAICAPVVFSEASEQNKPTEHHWAHLVMHGTLHLLGFDHIETADAKQMEQQEIELLAQLGIPDPYQIQNTYQSETDTQAAK